MKKILSIILACAMLLTMVPVSFAGDYAYEVKAGAASYEAKVGEEISVPIYVVPESGSAAVQMVQINLPLVEGLELASWTNGALTASDAVSVDPSINTVVIFQDNEFTASASTPLVTLVYKATAAGTYTIKSEATELYNADYDALEGTYGEAEFVLEFNEEADDPVVPPVVGNDDYTVKAGATEYTTKVNEEISVPVYVVPKAGDTAIQMVQINLPLVEGLELASWTNGALTASDAVSVDPSINTVVIFQDNEFTASASTPLVTLVYKATAAGTYTIKSEATELYNADYDALEGTYGEAEFAIVVEGGVTPPPAPTLESITVAPVAFEVPYGADALTAVKAAITAVTAKYSDGSTAAVTDYTVALDGADKAVVTYEGKTAEIALTYEPAPVVLADIAVDPSAFEVPYGTVDVLEAVKGAITAVTAKYSDGSTAAVTDYTVALDGTNKAVVTYEGKTAEIALTYEAAPVVPPVGGNDDYTVKAGADEYTAEVNEEISVPVYVVPKAGDTAIQMVQINLPLVEGLELASWTNGALTASDAVSVDPSINTVVIFQDNEFTASASTPLVTLVYKATAAGTYTIKSEATELYNADYDALEGTYGEAEFTIVVEGGVTPPPAPTLESITVNPTAVEVPYGVDAKVAVEDAITGVTAVYSDGTTGTVTGWSVEIDGDKAIVTYEGKTAEIALTFAQPPVTDVEIIVAVNSIVVPYNITVPVETYAVSQVGEVKVKNSEGAERVVEAQITYDAAESVVVVAYADLTPVKIPVTVITLVDYTIGGITGVIEIPYDCADPAGYVKGIITVTANLSDGSTMEIPYFTVEVNADWTAADVLVNGEKIEVVDTKKGAEPVAAITGIKVEVADAIVVPYGTDDVAAYIKSKIVVKTVDEDGVEAAISDYTVVANDGYADIAYGEFTESVDFTVETAELKANVTAIEIPYTVAEADYAAYIAQNVALTIDYSANTADKPVVATAADVVIDVDVAIITIEGLVVEVQFTVQPAPEYIATAVPAYGLEGKVLVKITGVADGKIAVVNGLEATYFGNGNFAVVVDEAYTVELVAAAAMPVAAEFGKLHPAGVTAWDALVTNDEALEKDVEVFEDIQMYVIADLDGNGKIEAIDALNINKISLFQGSVAVPTWVDAE